MLPRLDLVKEARQAMRFLRAHVQQLTGSQQGAVFGGKGKSIDDFHAVMNS
jgi:hypothetical protein